MRSSVKTTAIFAALCLVMWTAKAEFAVAGEELNKSAYCEQFAEDIAAKNAREIESGIDLDSALAGAVEGVILGEVIGGRRNTRRDARAGAAIGAVSAGIDFRPRFARIYRRAFATCMAQ